MDKLGIYGRVHDPQVENMKEELYHHDLDIYNEYFRYACSTLDTIDIMSTQDGFITQPSDY